MQTVTVSPKYQIVIPRELRKELHLIPGEKLQVFRYSDRLEFIPIRDIKKMRGVLQGISNDFTRELDRT